MPKDYLLAGRMLIAQTESYVKTAKRMVIAKRLIEGAAFNMLKNLKYYNNREKDTTAQIAKVEALMPLIADATDIEMLMGIEGNIRINYYKAFNTIINDCECNGVVCKQYVLYIVPGYDLSYPIKSNHQFSASARRKTLFSGIGLIRNI
jgi:hypothetical protein